MLSPLQVDEILDDDDYAREQATKNASAAENRSIDESQQAHERRHRLQRRQAQTGPAYPANKWQIGQPIAYIFDASIGRCIDGRRVLRRP